MVVGRCVPRLSHAKPFSVFVLLAASLLSNSAWAQNPGARPQAGIQRRPFAKPGTPRREERIRYFDIKHVKAELTLNTRRKEVRGTVTHTLSPLHPFLTRIELDCAPELKVTKVSKRSKDGSPANCSFSATDSKLVVTMDKSHGPGDDLDLAIEYSGSPTKGLTFVLPDPAYPEKRLAIWTQGQSEDTHYWLPCYDYPNERATSEMIITVDKPLFVVSNGALIETKNNTAYTTTYHWKMDVPHVSYLISLAVADFSVYHDKVGDLPVDYYVASNVDEATARRFMGKTPRMIRFFSESTGQPYPYVKYATTCLPDFGGGMENISATSMTDGALRDEISALEGDADGLVAHELAHQWFGDLLTCKDWSHIWLNEGFASYFDPLFTEHDRGEDAFRLEMEGAQQSYLGSDRFYRRPIVETRYESSQSMFDGMTYAKGACVLHTLRGLLGNEIWWKGLRAYVAAQKAKVVETDDFRKAMEAASGKDLKWFFDQWVYKAGHPELKVRWRYEDADRTVRVKVEQTQTIDDQTPLFRLPTILEITEDIGKTRKVPIVIDAASHEFAIPCPKAPRMVQIDPLGWLIKEIDFEKALEENLFQLEHAGCVLGRLAAARALAKTAKESAEVRKALSAAWKREQSVAVRREIVALLATVDETSRAGLLEAARSSEAKIRVAAIEGLARLKRESATETVLRAAWTNPKEAYGARKAALRGLVAWKVQDADQLLDDALKIPADRHSIAATALELLLQTPGARARELAALYCQYGQPRALRSEAVAAIGRMAKDDESLQDILVTLVNDPDRSVRFRTWGVVRALKLRKAVPALKARVGLESIGFTSFAQRMLEDTLEAINQNDSKSAGSGSSGSSPAIAELDRQAIDLETKARELRSQIEALKAKAAQPPKASSTAAK
jgi:aminopeptidase N